MLIDKLVKAKLIHPPKWMVGTESIQYLTVMGSVSYGVSDDGSDVDVYGFCIPPKDMVFPHLAGEILGFGEQIQRFNQWQQHHIASPDGRDTTYDCTVFNIVKYFQLCMQCNPNMIDSLFTPRRCVMYSTQIGEMVRENRKLFLHKGAWHTFRGYAYAQMHKIKGKIDASQKWLKPAYHVVRLLSQVEQIMVEQDLDLERNREQLKSIRRGEWTLEQIERHFEAKERALETTYASSTLQHSPDEAAIKAVLMSCLEMHFGSIADAVRCEPSVERLVRDIQVVLAAYSG